MQTKAKYLMYIFLGFGLIIIDQTSKLLMQTLFVSSGTFFVFNKGIAFGLPLYVWIILLPITALAIWHKSKILIIIKTHKLSSCLIISGALSNLIDRFLHNGQVVDFIKIIYWPIFNIADLMIVTGSIMLIFKLFPRKNRKIQIASSKS